jgi:XTP/dITP diphosphohydrolase
MAAKLLIATTNPAKLAEYRMLLRRFDLDLLSLRDAGVDKEAPENGTTFRENARIKAAFYFVYSGLPTLADDGGLEVDALGGAPGVMSHRWLGSDQVDDRILAEEVVRRMAGVEPKLRGARIRAAAAMVYTEQGLVRESIAEAALEGVIADRCYPHVRIGFPYRSVLYLPDRGRYLAEISEEQAASISQRQINVERLALDLMRLATVKA